MQKMQSRYGNACITYHFYLQNKVIQKHEDYYLLETLFSWHENRGFNA